MEAELRGATDFDKRNDYSVALMYLGRHPEAVSLLEQLESEKPGQYSVAANLGTAYELIGNNTKALHWITEGIRRNPNSHEGTEWLHARILETKLQLERDPAYLERNSVLSLDPGDFSKGVRIGGSTYSTPEVRKAIEYQLMERVQFVKPPDPVVASLIFDYAIIAAVEESLESSLRLIDLAKEYGYPAANANRWQRTFERRIFWTQFAFWSVIVLALVGAVWGLRVLYKRRNFVIYR